MKYIDANIKNVYEKNPKLQELLQNLTIKEDEKIKELKKGLFLYGIAGSGKTYSLYAIKNVLRKNSLDCGNVENWVELLYEVRERYSNNQGIKYFLENFLEKEYIFLDDIGAENQTNNSQELLYLILDRVNRYEKKLFITTNLELADFSKKYGDRLTSRIAELCETYEMKDQDLRLNK
jgi:DNA replication protein DnaC